MNQRYDAIIELGYRFNPNWELAQHLEKSISVTADLYKKQIAPLIITAGKWSLYFDYGHRVPPFTEAAEMEKRLIALGVPKEAIIKEENSKDTIGNAYFVKTDIVKPRNLHSLLIISAEFHAERVQYIFKKMFGEEYTLDFKFVPTLQDKAVVEREQKLLKLNIEFLSKMKDGDDEFLRNKLYQDPFYIKK